MKCPTCSSETYVTHKDGAERRRRCANKRCDHRFSTTEVLRDEHQRQREQVQVVLEAADKLKATA